jgi:hypothetical protein
MAIRCADPLFMIIGFGVNVVLAVVVVACHFIK